MAGVTPHTPEEEPETNAPPRRMRRWLAWTLRFLMATLWVFTATTALEFLVRTMDRRVEHKNPFVHAYLGKIPWPKDCAEEPPIPAFEPLPPGRLLLTHEDRAEDAWLDPVLDRNGPEMAARIALFPGASDAARNAFAITHSYGVVWFDKPFHGKAVYGSNREFRILRLLTQTPHGRLLARILRGGTFRQAYGGVQESIKAGRPVHIALAVNDDFRERLDAWCVGAPGVGGFVFFDASGDSSSPLETAQPDSPWAVPFFKYKPNLRGHKGAFGENYDTNEFGLRDDTVVLPKPEKTYRILCVGGSTTEEGPTNAETYPNLVERHFREHPIDGWSVDVVNCGISGMTTGKHLLRMNDYLSMEPDLVVMYEGINDLTLDLMPEWTSGWWFSPSLPSRSSFARRWLDGFLASSEARRVRDLTEQTLANLELMRRVFRRHGVPVLFCGAAVPDYPSLSTEEREYYAWDARKHWNNAAMSFRVYHEMVCWLNGAVKARCGETGAGFIPTDTALRGGSAFFGDICHMRFCALPRKAECVVRAIDAPLREVLKGDYSAPVAR